MNKVVTLEFLQKVFNSPAIPPVIITDEKGIITYFNHKILDIYGVRDGESFVGQPINNYINVTKINEIKLNDSKKVKFYVDIKNKGEFSIYTKVLKKIIEGRTYYILTIENISNDIEQFDSLTNLYNKEYLKMSLKKTIKTHRDDKLKLALLIIKIKNFRKINDRFGFKVGDEVLKKIALRLNNHIKPDDIIARIDGCVFCIVLTDLKDYIDAGAFSKKLIEESKKSIVIDSFKIKYSLEIGISSYPDTSKDYHELMKHAYFALKNINTNSRYKYYSNKLEKTYQDKIDFENKLRDAIKNKELYLVYHPQVNLINDKIIGVEALLRWDYATSKNINTETLIRIAEESEIIGHINRYVLEKIDDDLKIIHENIDGIDITFSINLSPHIIDLEKNLSLISKKILSVKKDYNTYKFQFELTESSFMEHEKIANEKLKKFIVDMKNKGIQFCIDDFGMEYSSIRRLLTQNFDVIKIHKSFVDMLGNKDNVSAIAIVRSIISLGNDLNFKVVAEGVETSIQVDILKALGCHHAQGFYFYKPLKINDLINIMVEVYNE